MIGFLRGEVLAKFEDEIIVDVNDVGYQVTVPDSLPGLQIGSPCELYIHTHVREDALELYGFSQKTHRQMFQELLTVSRIGPKVALNVIANLPPNKFARAILQEDLNLLKEVRGIGSKSAQRMILELKNKVDDIIAGSSYAEIDENVSGNDELFSALNNLGYNDREISRAIAELDFSSKLDLEEKIRQVLSFLGKE